MLGSWPGYAFALIFAGALWLAFVARNDWSVLPVILGLITVGVGQGALMTLLLNVLVSEVPKELASDVGSSASHSEPGRCRRHRSDGRATRGHPQLHCHEQSD